MQIIKCGVRKLIGTGSEIGSALDYWWSVGLLRSQKTIEREIMRQLVLCSFLAACLVAVSLAAPNQTHASATSKSIEDPVELDQDEEVAY